ncbi:hypothetical protein ACFX14_022910 [Malus domestica]
MKQKPCIPISLYEYFPKNFFQQCTTAACHVVDVEIEEPSKDNAITIEEERTLIPKEGLSTHVSIKEALQLPEGMRKALIVVLASLDDHEA